MGLFDFFRKGKEENIEQKQSARQQAKEGKPKSSIIDLESRQQNRPLQDRPPVHNEPGAISPEYYEIKKGDTLSAIAELRYGDSSKWRAIYEANKDVISNPDMIYPGQKIKIPKQQQK